MYMHMYICIERERERDLAQQEVAEDRDVGHAGVRRDLRRGLEALRRPIKYNMIINSIWHVTYWLIVS